VNVDINKISSNTKNIVYLIMLIGQAAWVVFMVFANQKEIQTTDSRSEKRYKREIEFSKDHETRLRKLEASMHFNEGKNSKEK
jgi:hypothetical protein